MSQGNQHRRSRRLSITQHLQRMFHAEKPRENDAADNDFVAVPPQPSAGNTEHAIHGDNVKNRSSHVSPLDPNSTSHPSSQSRISVYHNAEDNSSPSSGQSTPPTPRLRLDTPSAATESPTRPEICVSPTWQKSPVIKSERRATRRLEAERLELEKRLLRLERAEVSDSSMTSRREPRRLTKKQPLESSSRTSSMGADESRASRLSSVFSRRSSRSRSRSRSSSVHDDKRFSKRWSIDRVDLLKQDRATQASSAALPVTLPERFGNVISKELAVKQNGLPQSTPPEHREHIGADGADNVAQLGPKENPHAPSENIDQDTRDADTQKPPKELDRTSFAASLNLDKRTVDAKQTYRNPQKSDPSDSGKRTKEAGSKMEAHATVPKSSPVQNGHHIPNGNAQPSFTVFPSVASNTQRTLGPRHQKRFTSSPLASPATFSSDTDTTSGTGSTNHINDSSRSGEGSPSNQQRQHPPRSHRLSNGDPGDKKTAGTQPEKHRFYMKPWKHADTNRKSTVGESTPNKLTRPLTRRRDSEQAVQHQAKSPMVLSNSASPVPLDHRSKGTAPGKDPSLKELIAIMGENSSGHGERSRSSEDASGRHAMNHHGRGPSNVSLSTKSSRGSVDYNTADEGHSGGSRDASPSEHPFSTRGLHSPGKSEEQAVSYPTSTLKVRPKPVRDSRQLQQGQMVGKLFVACCHCNLWHDMPSEVYARLAFPRGVPSAPTEDGPDARSSHVRARLEQGGGRRLSARSPNGREKPGIRAKEDTPSVVRCCWCEHVMSRSCCQGWTTVVQMRERHH